MEHSEDPFIGPLEPVELREPPLVQTIPVTGYERPAPIGRLVLLPVVLFVATCLSTYYANGLAYAVSVMLILTAHELGHFFQALRYRVPASLPFFIPMPYGPVGTMGAVIGMQAHVGDRKALYDIGITGPLAGLVPSVICSIVGLQWSHVVDLAAHPLAAHDSPLILGRPLLYTWLKYLTFGPLAETERVSLHPLAFAGWVGIFITGLNLIPIGQLDGGHILYALLRRRSHAVAMFMIVMATLAMFAFQYWGWSLMLFLLFMMGPRHPPTADDTVPLGKGRIILGWLTLAFVVVGFTPEPFRILNP